MGLETAPTRNLLSISVTSFRYTRGVPMIYTTATRSIVATDSGPAIPEKPYQPLVLAE